MKTDTPHSRAVIRTAALSLLTLVLAAGSPGSLQAQTAEEVVDGPWRSG